MPMLDEDEYRQVMAFLPVSESGHNLLTTFTPMLAEFEQITGIRETNPNAIFHHRVSLYGPPCESCGKPLRTPQAKVCGHCMKSVS
jgi:hypothetical protein